MGQMILLPVNMNELIPPNHLVRVMHEFVEQMDLTPLEAKYVGGGTSSYHPKMMLKVYLYAYSQKIFTSWRIAKALRESIPFMWLSGNNRPGFRTINYFRGHILKGVIEEIFVALLVLLVEAGYIKLEANANKYSFVWAKSTARYEKQLAEKVKVLFEQIEQLNAAEDAHYGEHDLEEVGEAGPIAAEKVAQQVDKLNERLKKESPEQAATDEKGPDDRQPPQDGGEGQLSQRIEGQLKAAYNNQTGTENQFVVGFSLHQEAGDTTCMIPHLKKVKRWLGKLPAKIDSDAGYGSEENYAYLNQETVGNFLKYIGFDREQKKRYQPDPFKAENMPYDPLQDEFTCPNQKQLTYVRTNKEKTRNGYRTER
jgi:transposase